jgi:hypothetical protein
VNLEALESPDCLESIVARVGGGVAHELKPRWHPRRGSCLALASRHRSRPPETPTESEAGTTLLSHVSARGFVAKGESTGDVGPRD